MAQRDHRPRLGRRGQRAAVRLRIGLRESYGEPRHLRLCVDERARRSEAGDDRQRTVSPVARRCRRRDERPPHLDRLAEVESAESFRQDSDNREHLPIGCERCADDGRVGGETTGPEAVANDDDRRCGGGGIGRRQQAAERRTDTEQRKVLAGDRRDGHARDRIVDLHDAGVVELRSGLGEGRHVRLERQIVRVRRAAVRAAAVVAGVNGDERSGIGHARRRSEQQRAHEPEHGRVCAGRDSDGQEGDRRSPRRLDDHPQRVPHILNEAVHGSRFKRDACHPWLGKSTFSADRAAAGRASVPVSTPRVRRRTVRRPWARLSAL